MTDKAMIPIKETAEGVVFHIQVLPKSSKRQITGLQGDFLKIKITAPPVDGRANEECIRFLADLLDIKKDQVHIVGGLNAKKKTVSIKGLQKKDLETLILSV
ncbi:MAG TPA: DUF167 domain-containing protein [Syntrophales bacterium]|nr:DUF167 domain-containing protein [Syntrophales bacterium]